MNESVSEYLEVRREDTQPNEPEAETALVGCVLMDAPLVLPNLSETLPAGKASFYDLRNAEVFGVAESLFEEKSPVDSVTVSSRLRMLGQLERCGGIQRLGEMCDKAVSAHNFSSHAALVHAAHIKRRIIAACSELSLACRNGHSVDELIESAEVSMLGIRERRTPRRQIKELVVGAINRIEDRWNRSGELGGLSTGFPDLDKAIDGMAEADLIIPAAFTSVGKTSLLLNIAEHVALELGKPVGIISLEMTAEQLTTRLLCSSARVNLKDIFRREVLNGEMEKMTVASARLSKSPIHISEDCSSVSKIKAEARRMKQEHGIVMLGVDYLQLVDAEAVKGANREQEVAKISKALKALAKELRIPIIAPSQLNEDGKLRESRAIGQDADHVWMLEPEEKQQTPESGSVTLWIRKNRNGPRDVPIPLTFLKSFTRFVSASKVSDEDYPRSPYND